MKHIKQLHYGPDGEIRGIFEGETDDQLLLVPHADSQTQQATVVGPELVLAVNSYGLMLAALLLDREYLRHLVLCSQCRTGNLCERGLRLWAEAGDARDRAILLAEENGQLPC